MRIRPYRIGDAAVMACVYERAVRGLAARDYSRVQQDVWVGAVDELAARLEARMADGRRCWIAVNAQDKVVAFVDLEADGHIDFLYADPDVAGAGVAGALLDRLEEEARECGLARLHVEASETARRFFFRRGYQTVCRRDFEVRGVAIHNYAMERRL